MKLFFGNVRRLWGLPTLTTSHIPTDSAVMRDLHVDWLCPIWAQYHLSYNFGRTQQARAEGLKVWSYISLEPYPPCPNWRLDSPLMEARTLWWQVFHQNMDGFLYWGLNIWDRVNNDRAVDPAAGPFVDFSICSGGDHDWLYGDGALMYPGVEGPIGSIRLANIRDGLQDWELLWMLGEMAGDREVARQACLPVAASLDSFATDPEMLIARRRDILRQLAAGRIGQEHNAKPPPNPSTDVR